MALAVVLILFICFEFKGLKFKGLNVGGGRGS
jgi:hypothetical protein